MNIRPTTTDSVSQNPMPPTVKPASTQGKHALHQFMIDEFQPEQFKTISEAWKNNPDVRPEVMAAAKQFATDPNYPTPAQLQQLAAMIVGGEPMPPVVEPPVTMPPITEPPVSATDLG